jgi:hypothetical protein
MPTSDEKSLCIERFVTAYQRHFSNHIDTAGVSAEPDAAAQRWISRQELQAIHDRTTPRWLDPLLRVLGSRVDFLPLDLYRSFTWDELELPLFRFLGHQNRLFRRLALECVQQNLWMIGSDFDDGGIYFVDLSPASSGGIFWVENDSPRDVMKGPLASSLFALLEASAILLEVEGGADAQSEHSRAVAQVSSMDAMGISSAWQTWWATQLRLPR